MQRSNSTPMTEFVFLAFSTIHELHILLFVLFFLILLGIVLENVVLLAIIIADCRLHVPMYFFLWNWTLLEIGSVLVVMPRMILGLLTWNNRISLGGCAAQMFFFIFLGNGAILVVVVMAYDRYVAVSNPLRYKTIITTTVCLKLLVTVMLISFFIALAETILAFSVPYCGSNKINHFFCDVAQVLILASHCTVIFYFYEIVFNFAAILTFNIPFFAIMISYIYIIVAILKIRTTEGRRKAFLSCSSHLNSVILSYTCLVFIYLRPKSSFLWDKNRFFPIVFTFFSAFANPLIYSLRNKVVQSAFRKVICRTKPSPDE